MCEQIKFAQLFHCNRCTLFMFVKTRNFRFCRIVEIHIILMRAKRILFHKFGNKDFLIDLTADIRIAVPFRAFGIIWRCGSERYDFDIFTERRDEFFKCFLPFVFQMMSFVKAYRLYTEILHNGKNIKV